MINCEFWNGKRVFITGHTGFKGAWLCEILTSLCAKVYGYALPAVSGGAYNMMDTDAKVNSTIDDIRDYEALKPAFDTARPDIVFHLAAQPIVLDSYERPAYTFETNIQGTVNILECIRQTDCVKSAVIITTDKVYRNNEWVYSYRESDTLGGGDPYSASKACAELVTASYVASFFQNRGIAVSTTRSGNVIGGGDVAQNRIIPDCVRAAKTSEPIIVRNRHSVRPYQHVLEPLHAYMMIAERQWENPVIAGSYNIGPNKEGCVTTGELVDLFCDTWSEIDRGTQSETRSDAHWVDKSDPTAPHESGLLTLDCSLIRSTFGWQPAWSITTAITKTVEWEKAEDKKVVTRRQIEEYLSVWQK